jgi:beta-phosphoglucomutase-like phosphatase (HAD superfamily)
MADLYLFDIDGTMVDLTQLHVKAYKKAYKKVVGIDVDADLLVKQFGNAERIIHENILNHYNITDLGKINKIIAQYTLNIKKSFVKARIGVLPGVKKLLAKLKAGRNILGVVTGNSRQIGKSILKKAGLYSYFSVYSYGEVSKRGHIVRNAIRMARQKYANVGKVIVIGDAPFDVLAGKENKAITVSVATGRYSLAELRKEKPDYALKTLRTFPLFL